jgi:two-component system KDP operon response regulator KdpE
VEQKNRVLVVEDDAGIRQSLFETLGALGLAVGEANNGEEALQRLRMVNYHAVLLDINMPAWAVRISQSYPYLPIVMLTVRDEEDDIVEALDAGASDYVTKPFQIRELTARLRAMIRPYDAAPSGPDMVTVVGDITLDSDRRRVEKSGEEIHLAPKEYETLRYLMEHAARPVRHDRLPRRYGVRPMAASASICESLSTSYERKLKTPLYVPSIS